MTKCIIFDFDNTLVDNTKLDYEGFKKPSYQLGLHIFSKKDIILHRKHGLLANEIIKKIKLKEKNNFSINNFLNLRKIFLNSVESNIFLELRTGSKELLYFLKKNNVKCYLCSVRSNKKTIYLFLKKNNLLQYFSGILLPKDLKINIDNSNHSNRILIKTSLIRKITKKINSNDIVYVGDSSEDIISAKRLFIKFVLFKSFYLRNDDVTLSKVTNMKILKNYLIDFLQL